MSNNVFSQAFGQIRDSRAKATEAGKQKSQESEVNFLLSLRNDKTNADEAIIWITSIMWVVTAFVIYLGFNYYYQTFQEMFPPAIAFAFAVALPAVVEIAKIKLASRGLRSLGFGWFAATWANFGYWSIVLALAGGSYYWSYTISTGGIQEVARQSAEIKNEQAPLSEVIAVNTADIDARINDLNQSDAKAAEMKTKRGRVNWYGQSIQQQNATSRAALAAERATIVQQTTEKYYKTGATNETRISAWADFVRRFGGWGEVAVLICLVATLFFEMRLAELNKTAIEEAERKQQKTPNTPLFWNKGNPAPGPQTDTFFNRQTDGQVRNALTDRHPLFDPHPPTEKTVSQPRFTVSQQNGETVGSGNGSDALLKLAMKRLKGFAANFDQRHRNNETVSRNINGILDETNTAIREPGFAPSRAQMLSFYSYLMDLLPYLDTKGWPYERGKEMARYILANVPERHENTPA